MESNLAQRSTIEVLDTSDVFITTTLESSGLIVPKEVPVPPAHNA
jgi:hypothetical protein